ncbi:MULTISPECIES: hypothetical protein [unclassified Variovorax]|uniref:hypothetical protein n=1 Tax=unclassified Variovorax TaxID=663243 RepID=UPI000837CEE9|nr:MULTISPECIES: hypothetical protein [unclassified Variovorax]PNG56040.1 hypothetical protein CHC07_02454 [Variovorax sp. B4]PNG57464.1 hypothetical protein CHC06_02457 [Variovorax sp. B2]VTV10158.1 hypothetical protein WDL1CHR_01173 [Variovorax sp. WDL1]
MKVETLVNVRPVIADGLMLHPDWNGGRVLPCLIIPAEETDPFAQLCKLQPQVPPGDVESAWAWRVLDAGHVYLKLNFERPVPNNVTVQFDVRRQWGLVSGILATRAVYLQPSCFGSKISEGFFNPALLIEVTAGAPPGWDWRLRQQLSKKFRREGHSRDAARIAADDYLRRAQEPWNSIPEP